MPSENFQFSLFSLGEITNNITEKVAGFIKRKQIEGLPSSVEEACEQRRKARSDMIAHPQSQEKKLLYKTLNSNVKTAVKVKKNCSLENSIEQLEIDYKQNNSHNLFRAVRELEGQPKKALSTIKDKQGKTHTNKTTVLMCWKEHFSAHLNTSFLHQTSAIDEIPDAPEDADNMPPITKDEIKQAIRKMKLHKAPGIDSISAEVLRTGGKPMVERLHKIFNQIW